MIVGDPQVVERDGERVVVDEEGYELVIRTRGHKNGGRTHYHHADVDTLPTPTPACHSAHLNNDGSWMYARLEHLQPLYSCCKNCDPNETIDRAVNYQQYSALLHAIGRAADPEYSRTVENTTATRRYLAKHVDAVVDIATSGLWGSEKAGAALVWLDQEIRELEHHHRSQETLHALDVLDGTRWDSSRSKPEAVVDA